ncbi:MAG: site-2 protease family protein [Chloroflexi bacterium]|nr:site-2 protease family protein [Chloroflexota bacterium]MCL5075596.1 site-2 protease family protein [Chloroflexota bacterium]
MSLLYIVIALLVAISVHEACHAWMAYNLGDPTAKYQGRLTLNPLAHLDPLGTLMMIMTAIAGFGIGWGKPVPVNPYNLRNGPKTGMAVVSLAGPASNLATAVIFAIPLRFDLFYFLLSYTFLMYLLYYIVFVNIVIAIFNLIPIPPLDGFKVLLGLLPTRQAYLLSRYEAYGPGLLLLLILLDAYTRLGLIGHVLEPASQLLLHAVLG